jgi:hypothetical protein
MKLLYWALASPFILVIGLVALVFCWPSFIVGLLFNWLGEKANINDGEVVTGIAMFSTELAYIFLVYLLVD